MGAVHARCCGSDVHKDTVVACVLTPGPGGQPRREVRTFGTLTGELLAPGDWSAEAGGTHVAMESTERARPFEDAVARLGGIPGVGRATAEVLVAEIGTDMARFPTDGHLAAWAALCPGHHEGAGKRPSGRTRKGTRALRTALVQAAKAARRTRATYLGARYQRLAARRGPNKAAIAVAHSILIIAYHLLTDGGTYDDLGADFFDRRDQDALERRLVRRLEALGNKVTVEKVA
jgi:transposase